MRSSDWSSDVCSSDLQGLPAITGDAVSERTWCLHRGQALLPQMPPWPQSLCNVESCFSERPCRVVSRFFVSGKDEVFTHGLDHFPRTFHAWLDDEDVTGPKVDRIHAIGGEDGTEVGEGKGV